MPYIYLLGSVFLAASSSILGGFFNRKTQGKEKAPILYNFLSMCCTLLFWVVLFCFDGGVDIRVVPYALLYACFYGGCTIAVVYALRTGSIVLTTLIKQLALICVSVWGFFFWDDPFTISVAIGLLLVVIALWLCLYNKKKEKAQAFNFKWLIYVLIVFVGNAGCSIVQKTQQMHFDGQYGNFLMLLTTALVTLVCLVMYLKSDKTKLRGVLKTTWYIPVLSGISNALLNLFIIFLTTSVLSPSLIYPVMAVGGIIVVTLFSTAIFKEKMHWWQWLGVVIGCIAVGILSS